jgi:tetratricopeptide (TPR) repeat protein
VAEELDEELYTRIVALTDRGNEHADEEEFDAAASKFLEALALIPEPYDKWTASTWVLAALGDVYFLNGDFARAKMVLTDAMHCPDAIGNPFIHMRLGQCQFELGNMERAKDELVRAYMGAGEAIFEKDEPRYLAFVKEALQS